MRSVDGFTVSNVTATTAGPFTLIGGKYAVAAVATGTGTIDLELLGPDGSTKIKVITEIAASPTYVTVDLPCGTYYVVTATFTAVYVAVTRIPGE